MAASAPVFLMETAYLQGTCVRLEELFKSLPAPLPQWGTTPNEPSLLFVSFCFDYKDLRLLRSPGGLKFRLHKTTVNLVSYAHVFPEARPFHNRASSSLFKVQLAPSSHVLLPPPQKTPSS